MYIAWTTLGSNAAANKLAARCVAEGLCVCAQVEGPITSHYVWKGRRRRDREYRITFKALAKNVFKLERFVCANHGYDTPEWIAIKADRVGEKYLSWAGTNPTNFPL